MEGFIIFIRQGCGHFLNQLLLWEVHPTVGRAPLGQVLPSECAPGECQKASHGGTHFQSQRLGGTAGRWISVNPNPILFA